MLAKGGGGVAGSSGGSAWAKLRGEESLGGKKENESKNIISLTF